MQQHDASIAMIFVHANLIAVTIMLTALRAINHLLSTVSKGELNEGVALIVQVLQTHSHLHLPICWSLVVPPPWQSL